MRRLEARAGYGAQVADEVLSYTPRVLLEKKKLLVTGVLTGDSIAFSIARVAQEQGARVLLTGFGKGIAVTKRAARALPEHADVLEMDVNDRSQMQQVALELRSRWESLDGVVHSIAFAPRDALGGEFLKTPWESVETAFKTSAYSLKELASEMSPLMQAQGGSIVSLDFDASVAWPLYDWMGVSKAALEAITRYLARDLGRYGIRANCVSAGPLKTMAAKGIPGFDRLASQWPRKAPLGWDLNNPEPVARAVAFLLSDWASGITGEILHVDGGYHAMGAELAEADDATTETAGS